MSAPRRLPGSYALLFELEASATIVVRARPRELSPGHYLYVGSAFGPGGVAARVGRHLAGAGAARHWHVDHLRALAPVREVWVTHDRRRREHLWARAALALSGTSPPVPRFGASDCRCPAHLARFAEPPCLEAFVELLLRRAPRHGRVERFRANC